MADDYHIDEATINLPPLARATVTEKLLRYEEAVNFYQESITLQRPFIAVVLAANKLTSYELAELASSRFGYPLFDIASLDSELFKQQSISQRIIEEYNLVGLCTRARKLYCAMADPTDLQAIQAVQFQTGMTVEPIVVEYDKLVRVVRWLGRVSEGALLELGALLAEEAVTAAPPIGEVLSESGDAPVVRYIRKIILDAIDMGASDIHFEPYEYSFRIRYRLDGKLHEMVQPPLELKDRLISRVKIIANMDIGEKRLPQDGRFRMTVAKGQALDFRASSLPTIHGEKIVLRILDPSQVPFNIDEIGFEPDEKALLLETIARPYGMILATGPTGSGKSTTLYNCLHILNRPEVNILTVEDPVEITLPGINQVHVNDQIGRTFAAALRTFLRQDPDIIMVGEIRDLETADIAIKAAQTGHLVFSTLHTNDAPSTLERLRNMGVPPFNLTSSLLLIIAQRLVRKLCVCKEPLEVSPALLARSGLKEIDESWTIYKPKGCPKCNQTGYKGRQAIFQMLPMSDEINQLILQGGSRLDLARVTEQNGLRTLRQSGLVKVKKGITSLEEVLAVT